MPGLKRLAARGLTVAGGLALLAPLGLALGQAFAQNADNAAPAGPGVLTDSGVLPKGSTFGAFKLQTRRQVLAVEAQGSEQNYLVALGNMAFSAPGILGDPARQAGISCATCHSSGVINSQFFIPGVSAHPGSADVTHQFFNPKHADGVENPLDIPSLRGIAHTAPYGRDGRFASLREFTRNVIVNEFDGPEPSPLLLDALVQYMQEFAFLPNPKLAADGTLTDKAGAAAQRGAELFRKRFAAMDGQSCASCHTPSAHFTDNQQHNVGTGQAYETPTLRGIAHTAPYFASGSAKTLDAVVGYFDSYYGLGLSADQKADLVAYLEAVGAGKKPFTRKDFAFDMAEILVFASTVPTSLAERELEATQLTVDTIAAELRDVRERWPGHENRDIRALIADWVLDIRRVALHAEAGRWADAQAAYRAWRERIRAERDRVAEAQDRSLYNRKRRAAYLERLDAVADRARGAGE